MLMNNTKTLILKERVRAAWIILWLALLLANVLVYTSHPFKLADNGSGFNEWLAKFFAPHNWLGLATILLTLNGLRSIWITCEQRWPVIKDFRFIPIATAIAALLIFVGVKFK